jgi:catechol 2,3-dioxygenase-like lactoylglutathione lyase family enzyme
MASPKVRWIYSGLRVQNLTRSIRFYEKVGFHVTKRGAMEHGGLWVDLVYPGSVHLLELNFYPTTNRFYEPFVPGAEFDHLGFRVDDIDGWVRQLRRWRLPIVSDFTESTQRLVYVRDPDGNWLEFYGVPRPPRPSRRRGA